MASLQELISLGKELGYEGDELRQFVKEEQDNARDMRAREREFEIEKIGKQRELIELEQVKIEKEQVKIEKERLAREEDYNIQLKMIEAETERLKAETELRNSTTNDDATSSAIKVKGPALPNFDDAKDDLDAYLRRFELFATAAKWQKENWAIALSSHLTGRALEVYSRLPHDEAHDYDKVKLSLMERFECTEEGFRNKFRSAKPQKGEQVKQFVSRLRNLFNRWLELSKCEVSVKGITNLLVAEQLLQTCGNDLQVYLKERLPLTLENMVSLAEGYVLAHGGFHTNISTDNLLKFQESSFVKKQNFSQMKCFSCGKVGHKAVNCYSRNSFKNNKQAVGNVEVVGKKSKENSSIGKAAVCAHSEILECGHIVEVVSCLANMPVKKGIICEDTEVEVLRDTGCSTVIVKRDLVPESCLTGKKSLVRLANGQIHSYPLASFSVVTPYFSGNLTAICMEKPLYDLMIGNIPGATPLQKTEGNEASAVTRAGSKEKSTPLRKLNNPNIADGFDLDRKDLKIAQEEDESLKKWFSYARENRPLNKNGKGKVVLKHEILYRVFKGKDTEHFQLVLPKSLRRPVLQLAHESAFGGHQGTAKTLGKIQQEFAWPGMVADITRYCQSCDICQRVSPKGRVPKVPLGEMPLIDVPFKRVAADLIGPIEPRSSSGKKYILTVVDYATRYPEAIALSSITTEQVAEAMIEIFSRLGVPEEIVTDRGSQFTSDMMNEVRRLLSIKHLPTTPYHAMGNGLVEKFNGTLKSMLKKMCIEQPKLWDRYLPAVLFAYREAPQISTGFSPFELLYGRTIRGPLTILRELWDKEEKEGEYVSTYEYVFKLREQLEETCKLAHEQLKKSQQKYKFYFDRHTKDRKFQVGDQVLVLLPTAHNKLLLQWKGPFKVLHKKGQLDYIIDMDGHNKIFHANMLKFYHSRFKDETQEVNEVATAVIDGTETENEERELILPNISRTETWKDVEVCNGISLDQKKEVSDLLKGFGDVLSDVPGRTHLVSHTIKLVEEELVRSKPYPIPYHLREDVNKEIEDMLKSKVIEPSDSPFSTPMIVVKKPGNGKRICLDFRKLNCLTVLDAEPMPDPEEIFAKLNGNYYFSKLDLCKGYWQVPLDENCKQYTAFPTDLGLFQFTVLPFGLVNAPATFNRLMRKVLKGLKGVKHFLDDILIFAKSWSEHMEILKEVLSRLRAAGLTAKLSKCSIAMKTLTYLGHVIGDNILRPMQDKVTKILAANSPTTKKELRSFLGLCGYYRKFIPNFATISVPLTDLTKKQMPNKLRWGELQEDAFRVLKEKISSEPVLLLPDLSREFILRTDASSTGLGAVLLQEHEGIKRPVAYASRKLFNRERNYSVIEREALGLVWAIHKFSAYLYGKAFVVETDHRPLTYLNSARSLNSRLMRWSLSLQPYMIKVNYIKGSDNFGEDYLSRIVHN